MSKPYDVVVKVLSVNGKCVQGHKVGDEWVISGDKTPAGICMGAFISIFPDARTLAFGCSFPWSPDPEASQVACIDGKNPVIFELRRVQDSE